ncbi:hypothetical protein BD408DRAFT_420276 [Parasitella parasitica]|nr:hypothetical protein BD408DRAFT_420276 [Parasitella parasitica]
MSSMGSQSLKNWNGNVKIATRKRKPMVHSIPVKKATSKQKRGKTMDPSQFLIDGSSPITPHPRLVANRNSTMTLINGPGRHRSVDIKGLILQLIEETYPPLICPDCFQTSSGRAEADQHLKLKHRGQKVFKCISPDCKHVYSSKPGLRYHLEHVHQISRINENNHSSVNRKSDRQQNGVGTATSTHSILNDKRFKKQGLSASLEKKLNDIYPITICPACNEEFKKKTHVITHLVESHHGEEPYKCVVFGCKRGKNYATREGLVYHLISYHDEINKLEE